MRNPAKGGASRRDIEGKTEPLDYATSLRSAQVLRYNVTFRRLTERLHQLGPRPVAEALIQVAEGRDPLEVLEKFAELEPLVRAFPEARRWPPLPLARVA